MSSVTFYLDGHKLKVMTAKDARNGRFTIVINPARLSSGKHRLLARFALARTATSAAAHVSRTLTISRCGTSTKAEPGDGSAHGRSRQDAEPRAGRAPACPLGTDENAIAAGSEHGGADASCQLNPFGPARSRRVKVAAFSKRVQGRAATLARGWAMHRWTLCTPLRARSIVTRTSASLRVRVENALPKPPGARAAGVDPQAGDPGRNEHPVGERRRCAVATGIGGGPERSGRLPARPVGIASREPEGSDTSGLPASLAATVTVAGCPTVYRPVCLIAPHGHHGRGAVGEHPCEVMLRLALAERVFGPVFERVHTGGDGHRQSRTHALEVTCPIATRASADSTTRASGAPTCWRCSSTCARAWGSPTRRPRGAGRARCS